MKLIKCDRCGATASEKDYNFNEFTAVRIQQLNFMSTKDLCDKCSMAHARFLTNMDNTEEADEVADIQKKIDEAGEEPEVIYTPQKTPKKVESVETSKKKSKGQFQKKSEYEIEDILKLKEQGLSMSAVAKKLGISYAAANNALYRYRKENG